MDWIKIFKELAECAKEYTECKADYWDGVEDCAFEMIDALVSSTIMTTRDATEAKEYISSLRETIYLSSEDGF